MRKCFNLYARIRHLPQFLKRTLSSRNDTCETHFLHESCALCIIDGHLRAGMQHKLRKTHLRDSRHAHVLNQYGVHIHIAQQLQHIAEIIRFALLDQRIDRHINFPPALMRILNCFAQAIRIEISRITACPEGSISQINSVCAARNRGNKCFPIARRRKQLHPFSSEKGGAGHLSPHAAAESFFFRLSICLIFVGKLSAQSIDLVLRSKKLIGKRHRR